MDKNKGDAQNAMDWVLELPQDARQGALELAAKITDWPEEDQKKVHKAAVKAALCHTGQFRKSGESYVIHPIAVASLAQGLGMDADALCAALLHDVIEDTDATLEELIADFGAPVAHMVEALTKIDALKLRDQATENMAKAQNLRKMILAMSRDMRVILIKLCDRCHNMRTLGALKPDRRRAIAKETRDIYAPIASRLGLSGLNAELLQNCFAAIHPWRHKIILSELDKQRNHHRNFIETSIEKIKFALSAEEIEAEVTGRHKSPHSVYAKMKEKKLKLAEVLDREGFRVIVKTKSQCYTALGALHSLWKPIPGFFKDYIAIPKINGYQSLHTALMNDVGTPVEVQLRTAQMHHLAEEGMASHWIYKAKENAKAPAATQASGPQDAWVWLQSLVDIQAQSGHSEDFLEHVKTDLFSDEVYVFTPSGEVISLPRGASALDLAFAVHSDVGLKAKRALVNQEPQELSHKLRSGDSVAIETAKDIQAQSGWIAFTKTGKAKSHIRAHLRSLEKNHAMEIGERLLEQALEELGMDPAAVGSINAWKKARKALGIGQEEALVKVACAELSAVALAQLMGKEAAPKGELAQKKSLRITGEDSEFLKMGRCCNPLPPDQIEGEISPNQGVMVHRANCPHLGGAQGKLARIKVEWEPQALTGSFSAWIKVKAKNERGALAQIAALIAAQGADVNNVRVAGNRIGDNRATIDFEVQVRSKFHLDRVIDALAKDNGVLNVL